MRLQTLVCRMDASGSDRKRGRGNNNSSTPTSSDAKDIPGYVYDPVRKRYFRSEEHAPNNNFNQPIDEILQRHRRQSEVRMRTWVHPSLEANHGLQKFLYEIESTWRSGKERRTICAAFQVRQIRSIDWLIDLVAWLIDVRLIDWSMRCFFPLSTVDCSVWLMVCSMVLTVCTHRTALCN